MSTNLSSDLLVQATKYLPQIAQVLNEATPFLSSLPIVAPSNAISGGSLVSPRTRWVLNKRGTAGYIDENDALTDSNPNTQKEISVGLGIAQGTVVVSSTAKILAEMAAGPNYAPVEIGHIVDQICKVYRFANNESINGDGYDGTNNLTHFAGLVNALSQTATYGGLTYSSNTSFRPYKADPGSSTALTLAQIQTDVNAINALAPEGSKVDRAYVSYATLAKIQGLGTSVVQFVKMTGPVGSVSSTFDFSVDNFIVNGVKFIADQNVPDGQIVYVGSNCLEFHALPDANWAEYKTKANMAGIPSLPIPVQLITDQRGEGVAISAILRGQLVVKNPRACGIRYNVSV